ncbi:MAG: carboxypeptidase-like regulatory domain-containing protein [Myxococcota bacterium]
MSAAEWAEAPPSLLEGAWLTDESGFVRLPGERSTVEREEEAAVDGGLLAVRVEAPPGVRRARLKLTLEQDGGEPLWLDTSANGADWPVPPGDWQLTVAMAGAETVTRPVTVGAARTEVLVPLVAASGARGRVLDEGGRPVEGACIDVHEGEQRALCVARSDLRGEFALAPPTGPRRLRASHPSHGMSLEQVATGPEPVTLRLAVRSRLILEVRAPDGALAVADVEVSPGAEGRTVRVMTREAPVELTNLDPGPQHVRVTAQDRFAPPLSLTMPERGELRRELRLEPLVSVEGVVVRNGVPVRGVPLWNEAVLGVESDAQGRFRFERLPPQPFELRIGFQGKRVWLPAPGRFEINLATGAVRTLPR